MQGLHRGGDLAEPRLGKDLASAKPSEYDKERLERLKSKHAHDAAKAAAEAALRAEDGAAAAADADAAAALAPAAAEEGGKVLKKRRSAGSTKATTAHAIDDDGGNATDTDRRGMLWLMRLLLKWTDGCGCQYVQREAALGTASLYGDTEVVAKQKAAEEPAAAFGVLGVHVVFEPHCFKGIHDAAGKVFVDYTTNAVKGRDWTITNIEEHYDFNAAHMLTPSNETFNFEKVFEFKNYIHILYKKEDFIDLEATAVEGIKSWRCTEGGTDSRDVARGGHGVGGCGFNFRSHPHVCFCQCHPCPHEDFTGKPETHKVHACKQATTDREQATTFVDTIQEGTPLASKGDLEDATAGGEPLWLSISKGTMEKNDTPFKDASGRTIARHWAFVDVKYLVKIKTDSKGDVHYEAWTQPQGERTVLTKPKILTVTFQLEKVEKRNAPTRYVMKAADYQRLTNAVKPA